ncbi:MAG: SpoIIIAH-like family protein [Lachnospiraceae bacterium]|nr:SpoIIIAH-like family protein [Lachnospiraceae bacterium]MDY4971472.1 SpoIIIAH-like family protein [Lachnospiraceae bacterium]
MKKLRRKNQLILTLLAVMIAVAGYLTWLPSEDESVPAMGEQDNSVLMDISEEDILAENAALEQVQGTEVSEAAAQAGTEEAAAQAETQEQESSAQPGEAVLTLSEQVENMMAEAQLSRQQVRTRNEETLNSIMNNENLSEKQRQAAADNLMNMTENAQKEANIEAALTARGIAQTLVTISETGVEVLIGSSSITDAQRAQIEDTVKREADVEISDIVISLMNEVNTEATAAP